MKAVRIIAVRHGSTDSTRRRQFTGARDVTLSASGRLESEAVAQMLASTVVAAVYSSPMERARATAEAIAKPHRLEVRVDPGLREMAFGAWEGRTYAELAPGEAAVWRSTPHLAHPPAGEPLSVVDARVRATVDRLRDAHPGDTIVVVSHAIVVRLLVLAALGLGPERLWSVDASPAGITEIEYIDGWPTVHRMNTLTHLDALRSERA